jgi:pimeloyl-ACP methyl ester carboxylesterase
VKNCCLFLVFAVAATAAEPPTAEQKSQIEAKMTELTTRVKALAAKKTDPALLADVDIYRKAAEYIVRFPEEFASKAFTTNTMAVLDTGLARAKELEAGAPSWLKKKGHVVRAYYSKIDGSVQPYGLTIPDSYDPAKPIRLDVWQHGTNRTLNEVAFITQQESNRPIPPEQDYIQVEPLGRMNLSYRWAGESDIWETIASVRERYNIDPKRILSRGFSMGGASTWHLALHHPGKWAVTEAGAGYVETKKYAARFLPKELPPYQEAMVHYYDAVDYARNAFNTPTVGYGGEIDAQLAASRTIREQLMTEGFNFKQEGPFRWTTTDLRALFLIGPKTAHAWQPDSKKESNAWIADMLKSADKVPSHLQFVTYTTRFNECYWLTVEGLDETYKRAEVDATRSDDGKQYTVTTKNVSRIRFPGQGGAFTIDGQSLKGGADAAFEKKNGKWASAGKLNGLHKVHGLTGPVDDAFMDPFLCVRPTGDAWNQAAQEYGKKSLDVFSANFAKWLRGDVRLKDDRSVSSSDIADYNLVLFGDPGSNSVMAKVLGKLPIKWTKTEITVGTQKFGAADHIPVLIFLNPLNPKRYVVINSGHTFGESDFAGTNALLYPRLGDYSVVTPGGEVKLSGFFNEHWQF